MADDLEDTIRESAQGPKRAKSDNLEVEQQSVADQIAADRYLASKKATRRKGLGVKFNKLVPPGTE